MENSKTRINSYKNVWTFLIPKKGIARKSDVSKNISRDMFKSYLYFNNLNKEAALESLKKIKGTLSKEYSVLSISDKQFGLIEKDFCRQTDNLMQISTTQQINNIFKIH